METKPLRAFHLRKDKGNVTTCIECCAKYMRALRRRKAKQYAERQVVRKRERIKQDPLKSLSLLLYHGALARSRKFSIPISINRDWIWEQLKKGKCQVTRLPFVFEPGSPFMPSLDQFTPKAGYTVENTNVVIWAYNAAKQDWDHSVVLTVAKALLDDQTKER